MLATKSIIVPDNPEANYVSATGPDGDDTFNGSASTFTDNDYRYHIFNATKTGSAGFVVSDAGNSAGSNTLEYLVIAGGGGGGTSYGGGGGAGGYRTATGLASPAIGNHDVTVGLGGAVDVNGGDSVFSTITSDGGGAGGSAEVGHAGGSGGGGGYTQANGNNIGGAGINDAGTFGTATYQGHNGGIGYNTSTDFRHAGGGGGGASTVGGNGNTWPNQDAGDGGAGRVSDITGSDVLRGGGGGGGADFAHTTAGNCGGGWGGTGGTGGGGNAGGCNSGAENGTAGTANTGGGGGGVSAAGQTPATIGGSGVVIIRYKFQN